MKEAIMETIIDNLKLLPFLFISFLIIEFFEHKLTTKSQKTIEKSGKLGPLAGAVLGIFPQCGFSVIATNLYITRIITLGTLIAIYLSTSDEMLPILIAEGASINTIIQLILLKLTIGITIGFIIDFIMKPKKKQISYHICEEEHCDCKHGIIKSSLKHTIKIFIFIFIITFILNLLLFLLGEDFLKKIFSENNWFTPFISSLIGLIPNCASSVALTELYLNGILTLAPTIAGLLTNSGIALIILFKSNKDLKENLKMLEKASKFLQKYVEDIIDEKNEMHVSYDLWEMHEGVHLYSMASIFAAFNSMLKIYEIMLKDKELETNRLKQENILKQQEILTKETVRIKEYCITTFYDENKKCFKRNNQDEKMDISLLGAVIPFAMFSPKEKKIVNTVEKIDLTLRTYTGGYKRFEEDHYRNGNPWPIATLWRALYYIEVKDYKKAKECLNFVVASSTKHGFLAEQVDNNTMEANWVIGLGWSHAMFMIVLEKLMNR